MANKVNHLLKTARTTIKYQIQDMLNQKRITAEGTFADAVETVKKQGYVVIEDYYSAEKCQQLRAEMDRLIDTYQDELSVDGTASDHRIFGADRVSETIADFYNDSHILAAAQAYHQAEIVNFCTMANKVVYQEGNLGSGGGWHRDTIHQRQFKSIIYLSDVTESSGAFQYLPGTHSLTSPFQIIMDHDQEYGHTRFTEAEIEQLLTDGKHTLETLTGAAGTMILVDTSGIHRGSPIQAGERYALTNYIFTEHALTPATREKFESLCVTSMAE